MFNSKEYLKQYNKRRHVVEKRVKQDRERRFNKLLEKYWNGVIPDMSEFLQHPVMSDYYLHMKSGKIFSSKCKIDYGIPLFHIKTQKRKYETVNLRGFGISIHRFIWECYNGEIPDGLMIDHIDSNKLNNDIVNLRLVNIALNNQNRVKRKGCTSRYRGVVWDKDRRKWVAKLSINNRTKMLGRFDDEKKAARAYDDASAAVGRDRLNFPEKGGD